MSTSTDRDDFLKSARWHSFLDCSALGLQLNLTIIVAKENRKLQSSRTCPLCHKQYEDLFPELAPESEELKSSQEIIDLKSKASCLTFSLGTELNLIVQECSCISEKVHLPLKDRADIAAKLLLNFLTSFSQEFESGQRALELSILRQMNHIVLSLFQGDSAALQRCFELILSCLIIILEAEGSWVQLEGEQSAIIIKGDEGLVKAYLSGQVGLAHQVEISYGQFKCNLGVLAPIDPEQASELVQLMAQECAIILETDNLFRLLNRQLSNVLGAVNSAILVIDSRENITFANKAAARIFTKSLIDLVGVPMTNILGPWVSLIEAGITYSVNGQMEPLPMMQSEDQLCWIDWQVAPIFDQNSLEGWLVLADDRSDYYRWQAAARRAERFASTSIMVGALAHELRNPLSAAKGLLQLMTRKRDPEQTRGYVDLVLLEIDRITRLLNEFLLLGKPALTSLDLLDLVKFIGELFPLLKGETSGTTIEVKFEAEREAPVRADPGQLTQVIINLVRNAVQSLGQTGLIQICLYQINQKIVLRVQDNGAGFGPGVIDKLFIPFFTTKERGTGLGLAVARAIIHNHDGEIEAGNLPGGGAVFTITLPVARLELKEFDVALIVEDKILNHSIEQALKALDYCVKVSGEQDLKDGRNSGVIPRLVVFERLTSYNNLITIEEIFKLWPGTFVLVLGELLQEETLPIQEQNIRYIDRPFEIARIISAIRNAMVHFATI